MKTVNVYNVKKLIEKINKGKYSSHIEELAIIEGPKGILISEAAPAFYVRKDVEDDCHTVIFKTTEPKKGILLPVPIKVLISQCEKREVPLNEFVQPVGKRPGTHYKLLLKSIEQIGLDPKDYPRKK